MYYFVEYLRALRALRIAAILLAIDLFIAIVFRLIALSPPQHIMLNGSADLPVELFFAIATVMGLIISTIVAGPLEKENCGHLELAWTKPISRDRLALASFAVDAGAIVVSQLMTVPLGVLMFLLFVPVHLTTTPMTGWIIACTFLAPIAWYACLTSLGASLKRGRGLVIGLGWLIAAIIIPSFSTATQFIPTAGGQAIHAFFHALLYIDPIAYLSLHGDLSSRMSNFTGSIITSDWALLALAVGYAGLALLQWRRVEA